MRQFHGTDERPDHLKFTTGLENKGQFNTTVSKNININIVTNLFYHMNFPHVF